MDFQFKVSKLKDGSWMFYRDKSPYFAFEGTDLVELHLKAQEALDFYVEDTLSELARLGQEYGDG